MRSDAWEPQIASLSQRYRLVVVDLPGHGGSAKLAQSARLPEFVAWFDRFIDEIGVRSISVAGHSMGALIATGIVATAPQKIRRVALLSGVHLRSAHARAAVEARADEIVSGTFDRTAPLVRWFSDDERNTAAYALVRRLLADVDANGYATAYRAFATGDGLYSDCWPSVTCPALFLTGDGDRNSTPEMAHEMATAAPLGRAVIVEGHRHMVNLTAPHAVNRALQSWLLSGGEA
jgi:pimeloyl-ACP methyl ester carboxylesterase